MILRIHKIYVASEFLNIIEKNATLLIRFRIGLIRCRELQSLILRYHAHIPVQMGPVGTCPVIGLSRIIDIRTIV